MEIKEQSILAEEQATVPQRGILHIWQSGGPSEPLCPERVHLSQCVLQVALGEHHGILLAQGGQVYSFGELLWRGLSVPVSTPMLEVSLQGTTVVRVASGGFHCAAVSEQGSVYMWGENTAGQCGPTEGGMESNVTVAEPYPVAVVDNEAVPPMTVRITDMACGREHSLALSARNELWAWGSGCQLGLVTSNFPVWKPQKVEHLAGRHVIQVACGAYHSLALVRSLLPQNSNTHKPLERRSPSHMLPTKKEESLAIDDAHYCPLGVELTESMPAETAAKRSSKQRFLLSDSAHEYQAVLFPYSNSICNGKENDQVDPITQTDGRSTSYPPQGLVDKNKCALPNELELQNLLRKLSGHSLEMQNSSRLGDTDSLSSHTSDDSYISSTPFNDLLSPCCKNDLTECCEVLRTSSPVGMGEFSLTKKKSQDFTRRRSSSLKDINQEWETRNSRCSLPATPLHATQYPEHNCGSKPSSFGSIHSITEDGFPTLETEVWSWGRGSEGQLGHGDQLARLQPLCIKSLTGEEVIKVAAGSHHSLALTAQCQVYSWGSNMCGQLGHVNSPVTLPQQVKLSDDLRTWDVSAGQSHSLLLADGDSDQPVLLYCGQQQEPRSKQSVTPYQSKRSCQRSPNRAENYRVIPALLPFCMEMDYISSVASGGQRCALLADRYNTCFISTICELGFIERKFYYWLSSVRKLLLTPLYNKESVRLSLGETCSRLFLSLCGTFNHLSTLIGQHSTFLSRFVHKVQCLDITSLHLLVHTQHFLDIYTVYCTAVGNFQVMGGFPLLHKLSIECLGSHQMKLAQLSESDLSGSGGVDLVTLLYWPLQQLHQYSQVLHKMEACYHVLTTEYQSLHQSCMQYESLSASLLRRKKEAEATFLFWKTHSGKNTEGLRLPQRRVLCESSNRTLTLQGAGRFSNHWFILFNDALVHIQFSTHHVYPLNCLWVKPLPDNNSGCYAIKITCPEESFTLVASTPEEKNKWLHFLNQEVDGVLAGGGQGASPGITAMSRTASYTFTGEGRFKDAQYTGSWHAGRVHGRGTMSWPSGRTYTGNFKNGLENGYGECIIPNKLLNKAGCYQGHWRDGKIHGFGIYRYATGEVYEGCFSDGQRHGYGMLSSGKKDKTASGVFIGQWVYDKKTGYGVYDDITRGEKYMGMWLDDERHGSAVVVTQYGVYYEGNFKENKMSGPGLLVSDDDTAFRGEFSEDWTVNGKGVLSLGNGDSLEGHFSGEWNAGLKVTGTYTKLAHDEPEDKYRENLFRLGQYLVAAGERWVCVFDECWRRLGCDVAGKGDRATAWENIAVSISSGRQHSPHLSRSQRKVLESLECIPQHGEAVTIKNYDRIQRYLTKACETPIHPLGWLVETLVTVYRMTYVGVGSNRRLLREAVKEVQAYLKHFYAMVRFLFPGLPEDGDILPETPVSPSKIRYSSNSEEVSFVAAVSCSSLILPLLLPQLYPPLFMLYCLHDEQQEVQYWEHILRFNKQPDQSLLSFLGVEEKFWPKCMSVLGEQKQIVSTSKDVSFVCAVETLQQISTTFTPADKLLVIQKTFEELTQEIKPMQDGDFLWCMDDLLPLFLYVVLRARIRNLGAEVSLIEDLMDPNLQHGELGLMLTTLKACYIQIQLESTT